MHPKPSIYAARFRGLKASGLILIACLIVIAFYQLPAGKTLSLNVMSALHDHLEGMGPWASLLYVTVGATLLLAGLPRGVYCLLGGTLFDFWSALLLSTAGSLAGSFGGFLLARRLGGNRIRLYNSQRYLRIKEHLKNNGFTVILLARLCPATNNLLINTLAGFSTITPGKFLAGSALGFLPSSAILIIIGSGIAVADATRMLAGLLCFIVASVVMLVHQNRIGRTADIWRAVTKNDELDRSALQ